MELKWKMVACDPRDRIRLVTWSALLPDGRRVWKQEWKRIGSKPHWQGMNEWSPGEPDEVLKVRYGLDQHSCDHETLEELTTPTDANPVHPVLPTAASEAGL